MSEFVSRAICVPNPRIPMQRKGSVVSLRKAVNAKCRECTYDPLNVGTPAQQIAVCIDSDCPLQPSEPLESKRLPISLLEVFRADPPQLDESVRDPVRPSGKKCTVGAQNGTLLMPQHRVDSASGET